MVGAATILERFKVDYELHVVSAHRTPEAMIAFGLGARERRVKVIIAGAGGAAHLPGMLAATTTLPVIGVPVALARLDGLDSLLSIVQMPRGVPVATVAINGAANAGLLAVRILGSTTPNSPSPSKPTDSSSPTRPAPRTEDFPGARTSYVASGWFPRRVSPLRHSLLDNRGGTRGCNEASIEHFPGQEQCGP